MASNFGRYFFRCVLPIVIVGLLHGCATPFADHYHDKMGGVDVASFPRAVISTGEPVLYMGVDKTLDFLRMVEDNYELIGYSSFNAGPLSTEGAIAQAKKVKASVLLWYSQYTGTVSGVVPLTLPKTDTAETNFSGSSGGTSFSGRASTTLYGTETSYIPYSVSRSDYFVSYWIKKTPPVFGTRISDLPVEIKQKTGSNKGVLVRAVIKNSPAYKADILGGDVIKKIGNDDLSDWNSYYDAIGKYVGQEVEVILLRNGSTIRKSVKLDTDHPRK
jgi:membrane-associated protease RseP (regulator of RpoE activity)